jgi:hypothetical protein
VEHENPPGWHHSFLAKVGEITRAESERITYKLSETGDKAHGEAACTEYRHIGPGNAPSPLVRHVREQTHDAQQHHELHRHAARISSGRR